MIDNDSLGERETKSPKWNPDVIMVVYYPFS